IKIMKWSDFMKTRSKRFLNLATLSLALLGTTLLMAQPVKAEGVQIVDRDRSTEQENIKKNYMERLGLSNLTGQYDKDRFEGYLDGYNKGRQPGAPKSPEKTKRYDPESENPSDGYGDGYGEGYTDGYNNRMLNKNNENREKALENSSPGTTDVENHGESQDHKEASTGESQDHKEASTGESQDHKEASTRESPVSDLLSVIGSLITFVLNWFSLA
ncbi:TPA: hypothetical protein ACJ68A_000173, partial [Streptococcus pyogenes]